MSVIAECKDDQVKLQDEIDELFEKDDVDEFTDLDAKANPAEPNDDLDELAALFEEEEKENVQNGVAEEKNIEKMEDEYLKLQAQMEALKNEMLRKKSSESSPKVTAEKKSEGKRTFAAAFSPAISQTSPTALKEKQSTKSVETKTSPLQDTRETTSKFYSNPPQKRPRTSNHLQTTGNYSNQSTELQENSLKLSQRNIVKNKTVSQHEKSKTVQSIEIEQYSRIRLKQRFVPASEMQQRMQSKTHLKLSLIRPTLRLAEDSDWVTVAVVAKQLDPQTAKNGKAFSIWHLTDLDDCTKHVAFFLFGKVHEELWRKITVGTVIGLLNPSIMPPKKDSSAGKNYDNTPALTVDVAERVMKIGVSADLGWCMATKYRNKQPAGKCLAFINKQYGETCVYHMQSKYKKISSKRGELQGSAAAPVADRYKKTLWNKVKGDQFFYGGQTFSAAPPSTNTTIQRKESKMKLTNVLGNVKQGSLEQKDKLQRSKVMQAIGGIKAEQSVTGCSDAFAEMLSSGDMVAGSRQFLNHLQQKEKEKILKQEKTPLSPVAVLQERKKIIQEKQNIAKMQISSPKPVSFISPDTIKKCTETLFNQRKKNNISKQTSLLSKSPMLSKALSQSPKPKLTANDHNTEGVDLFSSWLSNKKAASSNATVTLAELRKRKAMAKLRAETGGVEIKKSNPNQTMIGRVKDIKSSEKLKQKVQEKVKGNRQDLEQAESKEAEPSASSVLGSQMSEKEFERILNATSSHSYELDIAEMEKQEEYFNPLIKKEMMEEKMADTFEMPAKVVTCQQCSYTFWAPHERCKQLQHAMQWKSVKKRFFECTHCRQRTVTWDPYPAKACRECGSVKKWKRTCMLKSKDLKLDSEVLLIRGIEHSKFLNALR
uniref:Protein MCM10 homolog n=1 Tax=Phallusia mammillata TaxID=59560 RepID=A0A6F9DL30_9ASCI|nr:protein MCM10 homolog [Phallusia mammillata]